MGIFKRISDIISANLGEMAEDWEDPEVMLKQAVREMEQSIQTATQETARTLANEKKLVKELAKDEKMMWVVGGGEVVSENESKGIKEPEFSKGWVTVEADNWHFHLDLGSVDGIQFVEATSHGDLKSYYVRFSKGWEETLVRCYFPNPYLGDDEKRAEFQPEKLKVFEEMRDRYVGRDGIVFAQQ